MPALLATHRRSPSAMDSLGRARGLSLRDVHRGYLGAHDARPKESGFGTVDSGVIAFSFQSLEGGTSTLNNRHRDGFDVAYATILVMGLALISMVVSFGLDGHLDDNEQVIAVAVIGGLATVASAALGYQVGSRTSPRRTTDPGEPNAPAGPSPVPTQPNLVRLAP